jgi:hypothetical protein
MPSRNRGITEATDTTADTADTVTTEVSGAVSAVVDLAEGSVKKMSKLFEQTHLIFSVYLFHH